MKNNIGKDLVEIKVSLSRIEEHLKNQDEIIKGHTESINCMQKFNYKLAGGIAVVVFLIDLFMKFILKV
jgi:hypothetical protein